MVDGNTIVTQDFVVTFSGAIVGTVAVEATVVVFSSGNAVEQGTGSLTGSVFGRSGTIGVSFELSSSLTTGLDAQFVFLSGTGTGALANMEGHGTAAAPPGTPQSSYSVTVIFT